MTSREKDFSSPIDVEDSSIETVLHSIRRILAEEETSPSVSINQHADTSQEALLLDRSMIVENPTKNAGPQSDAYDQAPPRNEERSSEALMGQQTLEATERSLNALQAAMSGQDGEKTLGGDTRINTSADLTIEGMVRQEVRAMVRTWLDAHLPSLVEIMVRAEISKMTRR